MAKVLKTETCWIWQAAVSAPGYGVFMLSDKNLVLAHRLAYTLFRGPIPDGLVLDHLCRNPACCNPDHVEAVSNKINISRGVTVEVTRARMAAITHCKRGHAFDKTNTYYDKTTGARQCRRCCAEKMTRRNRQKRLLELSTRKARFCAQCNAPLQISARSDKQFCSSRCHKRSKDNYRSTRKRRSVNPPGFRLP